MPTSPTHLNRMRRGRRVGGATAALLVVAFVMVFAGLAGPTGAATCDPAGPDPVELALAAPAPTDGTDVVPSRRREHAEPSLAELRVVPRDDESACSQPEPADTVDRPPDVDEPPSLASIGAATGRRAPPLPSI